jgi:hypothetical protein
MLTFNIQLRIPAVPLPSSRDVGQLPFTIVWCAHVQNMILHDYLQIGKLCNGLGNIQPVQPCPDEVGAYGPPRQTAATRGRKYDNRSEWRNTAGMDQWSIGAFSVSLIIIPFPHWQWLPPPCFSVLLHLGINPNIIVTVPWARTTHNWPQGHETFKATYIQLGRRHMRRYDLRIVKMCKWGNFVSLPSTTGTLWLSHFGWLLTYLIK